MIQITKAEADYIRAHSNKVRITTTSKRKKPRQKKRYADEVYETFKLLRQFHRKKSQTR